MAELSGVDRRLALASGLTALLALLAPAISWGQEGQTMEEIDPDATYAMLGQFKAVPGKRAELAAILTEGTRGMPGCLAYIIGEDLSDADALWVVEMWTDKAAHDASLALPSVRDAITRGKPLIAGFGASAQFHPLKADQ